MTLLTPSRREQAPVEHAHAAPGEPARLVALSKSTDAVVSKRGVLLVRGERGFVLSAPEARKLAAVVEG